MWIIGLSLFVIQFAEVAVGGFARICCRQIGDKGENKNKSNV